MNQPSRTPVLELRGVSTHLTSSGGVVRALDGVDLELHRGETVGLVGESGSGKSMTALTIMGLVPRPGGQVVAGEVLYESRDLLTLPPKDMARIRGQDIAMVFQDPATFLNPVLTVGYQIGEAVRYHDPKADLATRVNEVLDLVGLPSSQDIGQRYPHELSGGMRQRVLIAAALACRPKVLIADEPTTALDVTIQAQILDLLRDIQKQLDMAMLVITHDVGIVADVCDRVAVMYAGKVVDVADVQDFFESPLHPYSRALIRSVRSIGSPGQELYALEGSVPNLTELPTGCRFHPRCEFADSDRCVTTDPELRRLLETHRYVACHYAEKIIDQPTQLERSP